MGTAAHMNARAVSTIRDAFGKCHASCPFHLGNGRACRRGAEGAVSDFLELLDVVSLESADFQRALSLVAQLRRYPPRILFVPQSRARVGQFLDGTLAGDGRRNGWQLAEAAHDATPYGMCSGSTVSTTGIGRVT